MAEAGAPFSMSGKIEASTADPARPEARRLIAIVAYEGVEALDVAGPAGVFERAEALRPGNYEVVIASAGGGTVATSGARSTPWSMYL